MKAIAVLLMLTATGYAEECYVAPVRQRQLVKSSKIYQYNDHHQQAVVLQQVTPHFYYGVGQQYTEAALVSAVKASLRAEQQAYLQQQNEQYRAMLRDLLQEIKQPMPGQPTTNPQPVPGQAALIGKAVLEAKCALCHMAGSDEIVVTPGPQLFRDDGTVMDWTEAQKVKIRDKSESGSMPPQPLPHLTDDEYLAVSAYLGIEPKAGER